MQLLITCIGYTDCGNAGNTMLGSADAKSTHQTILPDGIYLIRPGSTNYSLRVYCMRQPWKAEGIEYLPVSKPMDGSQDKVVSSLSVDKVATGKKLLGNEMESRLWTVVQRRLDGREMFDRTWEDYK